MLRPLACSPFATAVILSLVSHVFMALWFFLDPEFQLQPVTHASEMAPTRHHVKINVSVVGEKAKADAVERVESKPEPKPEPQPELKPAPASVASQKATDNSDPELSGVTNGILDKLIKTPRYREAPKPPKYPRKALRKHQQGTTLLRVLVSAQGENLEVLIHKSSGFVLLDEAAIKAVKKWKFEAGLSGERRVSAWVQVPVTFKLR